MFSLKYLVLGVTLIVALGIGVWCAVGYASTSGIETPKYTVVSSKDGLELREYAPHILAQVVVEGEFDGAINQGFRKVADYIFGNNESKKSSAASESIAMTAPVLEQGATSESIAMTAPVVETKVDDTKRAVSFVMPSSYTLETLPKPKNDEVKLIQVPKKRFAAITFSGNVDGDVAQRKKDELRARVAENKWTSIGEPILAQYDPPWTPPFMRKNEVLLEIDVTAD